MEAILPVGVGPLVARHESSQLIVAARENIAACASLPVLRPLPAVAIAQRWLPIWLSDWQQRDTARRKMKDDGDIPIAISATAALCRL